MKRKLLIVDKHQFGYLVDTYKWAISLVDKYDITLICMDMQLERYVIDGVRIKYLPSITNRYLRGFIFILFSAWEILNFKGSVIVSYFEFCSIFKRLFPCRKILLDIRTLSVSSSSSVREKQNQAIREACLRYKTISFISEGIRDTLKLPPFLDTYVVPLGADCISDVRKEYESLRLLYVGTLSGRDIDKTILGLHDFLQLYPDRFVTYDIVGDGFNGELFQLKELVERLGLPNTVRLHGYMPHSKLRPLFDQCNVGIAFVPIREYYEHQPSTKIFEYSFSGLYTIATKTKANQELINEDNGMLISDTSSDFRNALVKISSVAFTASEEKIRGSLSEYSWDALVKRKLLPIIERL
ncbi:glycosyltransferase family 4 protein [Porphyromonas gingivalis]|uniref:glycosyltransferase n=1 Tax=Porphyromonas gingivalis TaxID=837 RepID=UPI000974F8D0|nr:glycosyltransferase [Porphyromonas gingivalis]MCE8189177.1 glycosyltransferase family 4 protein [Porphyromonas gingivalis]SJL27019.1 Glycosyl transferases group 1 [Porphyromonas gingivalis]